MTQPASRWCNGPDARSMEGCGFTASMAAVTVCQPLLSGRRTIGRKRPAGKITISKRSTPSGISQNGLLKNERKCQQPAAVKRVTKKSATVVSPTFHCYPIDVEFFQVLENAMQLI